MRAVLEDPREGEIPVMALDQSRSALSAHRTACMVVLVPGNSVEQEQEKTKDKSYGFILETTAADIGELFRWLPLSLQHEKEGTEEEQIRIEQGACDMAGRIIDTEMMGYACLYPRGEEMQEEHLISITPENLVNFTGSHFTSAGRMVITGVMDRLIVDTVEGFLNTCPDQKLCRELIGRPALIQMGEQEPGEILAVGRGMSEEYFRKGDQMITMMEPSMG